ncbi:MAG: pilus assembly protein PilM, partial [Silvanigrellaceae bacterium]|nr:pilus assembly protein PilM [Silvanigrellaceae bacterium]
MQKVLGIDIGSYSIKVVTLQNRFNESRIIDYREKVIPKVKEDEEIQVRISIIKELIENQVNEDTKVFIAMPGLMVSSRIFEFMNLKKRLLTNIIENELDGSSIFSLEDSVYDYSIIQTKGRLTRVLTVVCQRSNIESLLEFTGSAGLNPKIIDVDYTSLFNLANYLTSSTQEKSSKETEENQTENLKKDERQDDIIIDIGHTKTSFILISNNKLTAIQVINIGGDYFTENLKKNFSITYNEAQTIKHHTSRVITDDLDLTTVSEKERIIFEITTYTANELINEISRIIQFSKAEYGVEPRCIHLTGGGCLLNGLTEYFCERLKIPTKIVIFNNKNLLFDTPDWRNTPTLGQALALGLRSVPSNAQSA